ncbi:acyltransferase family protein [Brevundimonas poindexterae]|uniref:acyltransferase family protein n=1 Tax=Brevundimonas poindexterae TaxID=74325 RepID=UPI001CFEB805|nr:acyltransferase family protein [Brevundimonas poindexterae]
MKHRRDIDGLRAVAVLPVLLFHAQVAGFGGGYVGVDIFFVISGYLITGILLNDLREKRFSIANFYERRARRILPALFAVAITTSVGAYALMTPDQFVDYGQSLVGLSLFASNVLFWLESGYFEASAEEKPLLHTWSLAVEEQFYIVFPFLLFILWKSNRRTGFLVMAMALVSFASLLLSQVMSVSAPTANFYLLPSRVWELMAGSIAALLGAPQISPRLRDVVAWLGLAAIGISVYLFSEATPFPSMYALMPVLGAAAVIMCASSDRYPGKLLATSPLVAVGLISYSLYLWHQPLLALYRIHSGPDVTAAGMMGAVILSVPLAWLSWRYVEAPFRKTAAAGGYSRNVVYAFAAVGGIAMVAYGALVSLGGVRLPFSVPPTVYESFARLKPDDNCFDIANSEELDAYLCPVGGSNAPPDFLLIGDSHGLSLKPAFDDAASKLGRSGLFVGYSGCPPLLGLRPDRRDQTIRNCQALVKRAYADAERLGIKTIILVGRWDLYLGDGELASAPLSKLQLLSQADGSPAVSLQANRRIFENALDLTAEYALDRGIELHIIRQVPRQRQSPESIYYSAVRDGRDAILDRSISRTDYLQQTQSADVIIARSQRRHRNISYYDVSDFICLESVCPVGTPGRSYYFDDDHLSLVGASLLEPLAMIVLEGALSGASENAMPLPKVAIAGRSAVRP